MNFIKKTKSILYGMEFTHGIRRALMNALILVYFVSLDFNIIHITTLFAVSNLIMMFFEFPTGAIADYDSRKKSLMLSFILLSIAFFGIFLFKDFWLLAAFWILGDIAWTFSTGASSAWAIDALKYAKKKSKIVSLISRGYFFEKSGHIIGGLIGLVIVAINFRFVWLVISLSNLLMFFIIFIYMEERNFKPEKVPHNYFKKSLIKAKESISYFIHKGNKELRVLFLASFIGVVAMAGFFVGVPLFFTETLGMQPEFLAGIFSIFAVLSLIGTLMAEKINSKFSFRISLIVISLFSAILMIIFPLFVYLIFAIVILGLIHFSEAIYDILEESAFQHEFSSKIRASLGSLGSISWSLASSLGVFLAGIGISLIGIANTMILSGALGFVVVIIYLVGLKK
jgi:MFS family permease